MQDLYALVYDINTANETWEWVDFKEVHDLIYVDILIVLHIFMLGVFLSLILDLEKTVKVRA